MTYHSQKALDEGVVSENDKRIFNWKEAADKAVKDFHPTITCTIDGYGYRNVEKKTRERLGDMMKKVEPVDGYRAKKLIVRDGVDELSGNLRIIGTVVDQVKLKTELTQRVLNMSSFRSVVKKRKMSLDVKDNLKKKCARRTSPHDLLIDAFTEHVEAEIETRMGHSS